MREERIWIIAAAVLMFLLVMGVVQLVLMRRRRQLERQYKELEQTLCNGGEQYRKAVEENRDYRHIRHDLKKQERIKEMVAKGSGITRYTGNVVLDSVLTQEKMTAESSGIALNIDVPDGLVLGLSDSEIVSLFANLLDNAREACGRCSEKSTQSTKNTGEKQSAHNPKRTNRKSRSVHISERTAEQSRQAHNAGQSPWEISIAITSTGNDMCIAVVNSKPSDEHPDVKDIKTSKSDKENHGFGVAIIRSIVAKYGGVMQMSDGGDVFRVEINITGI